VHVLGLGSLVQSLGFMVRGLAGFRRTSSGFVEFSVSGFWCLVYKGLRTDNFTEMCSGSEAGSYLRLIDFVYHPTLGLRVITKKQKKVWG